MLARVCWYCGLILILSRVTLAMDRTPPVDAPSPEGLAERLKSDAFSERQEAMAQLRRLGTKAIPTLIELARDGDADSRTRSLQILEEHFQQTEPQLQNEAKAALEELAKGEGPQARSAQRILNPPPTGDVNELRRRIARAQIMRAAQARVQIQIQQRPAQQMLPRALPIPPGIQVPPGIQASRNISLSISENGRAIRISQKNDEIKIEVTEEKNGQKVTDKYEAKNIDELKKNHPKGYEILEKYGPRFGILPAAAPKP